MRTDLFRKRSTPFSVGLLRTLFAYFECVLSVLHTVSVLILHAETSLLRHYAVPCAHRSKRQACVRTSLTRVTDLTAIYNWKNKKKKFKNFKKFKNKWSRGFLWKVRVKIYSARDYFMISDSLFEEFNLHCMFRFFLMLW